MIKSPGGHGIAIVVLKSGRISVFIYIIIFNGPVGKDIINGPEPPDDAIQDFEFVFTGHGIKIWEFENLRICEWLNLWMSKGMTEK